MQKKNDETINLRRLARGLFLKYFYLRRDMEDEGVIIEGIRSQVDFRGAALWILIFAIFVASLGLNVNSTAVIIGAMLISPLMGPIIGMGLAAGINDFALLKRSVNSYLVATVVSVITAALYFFFSPLSEVQSELLARTSPSIYDVFIALVGGLAGIIAVSVRDKGQVIPGVAIATALMPPLCTVGFGISNGHFMFALGALYLFFINTVFIAFATFLGVRIMKFRKKQFLDRSREKRVRHYIIAIAVVTMVPSVYMTYLLVKESIFANNVARFAQSEMHWPGTQIISQTADYDNRTASVVIVGEQVADSSIQVLKAKMPRYGLGDVALSVIQGSANDGEWWRAMAGTSQSSTLLVHDQSQQLDEMRTHLAEMSRFQRLSSTIMPEMKLIFPSVTSLSLSHVVTSYAEADRTPDTLTVALVTMTEPLTPTDRVRMRSWLKVRSDSDTLRIIVNQ